jgi:hypothetical protein
MEHNPTAALPKDDWRRHINEPERIDVSWIEVTFGRKPLGSREPMSYWTESRTRHAAAALALYGQPFGFTRGGCQALSRVIDAMEQSAATGVPHAVTEVDLSLARAEVAKIVALLPPMG